MSCSPKRTTSTTTSTTDVGSVFPRSTSATPNRTGSPTSSTIFPCTLVTRSCTRLACLARFSKASSRSRRRFGDECLSGAASASAPVFERAGTGVNGASTSTVSPSSSPAPQRGNDSQIPEYVHHILVNTEIPTSNSQEFELIPGIPQLILGNTNFSFLVFWILIPGNSRSRDFATIPGNTTN